VEERTTLGGGGAVLREDKEDTPEKIRKKVKKKIEKEKKESVL
jgi:hypothetical protein